MGEILNNPMMSTASGMVGNTVVFRQVRGKLLVANRPRRGRTPSEKQLAIQGRFTNAAAYAKEVLKDPVTKAKYEAGIGLNKFTAHMVAVSDYLNAPRVENINVSEYKGVPGNVILVEATDDFAVTQVQVSITSGGAVVESGEAVQDQINKQLWRYTATVAVTLANAVVQASAYDLPGNKTSLDKAL